MSRPSTATSADPTPTPVPASEERLASDTGSPAYAPVNAELIERLAHCDSMEELPPGLRENPFIRYVVSMTPEQQALDRAAAEAHREAEALYAGDPERILAAIEAGTHPLQRRRPARG